MRLTERLTNLFDPLVYFGGNWITTLGVLLTTTGGVAWLFTLPRHFAGQSINPYLGLLTTFALPLVFFFGLFLIPLGIRLKQRKARSKNRIGGIRRRTSGHVTAKSISIKGAGCKFGGCARKAVELTSGDLPLVWDTRLRVEQSTLIGRQKSAEGIVGARALKAGTVIESSRGRDSGLAMRQPIR